MLSGGSDAEVVICKATPFSIFYLKVQHNGTRICELRWSNEITYPNDSGVKLKLCRLIEDIIGARPGYLALPPARGAYA